MTIRVSGVRRDYVAPSGGGGGGGGGGAYPAWRVGQTAGTWLALNGTESMSGYAPDGGASVYAQPDDIIVAWNGLSGGSKPGYNKWRSWLAAGHGTVGVNAAWQNARVDLNLMAATPVWTVGKASSTQAASGFNASTGHGGGTSYYTDNEPAARHTYRNQAHLSAEHSPDGIERVMAIGAYAIFNTENGGGTDSHVHGQKVTTNVTDAPGKWKDSLGGAGTVPGSPGFEVWTVLPSFSQNPANDKIYWCAGSYLLEYNPSTVNGDGTYGSQAWIHTQSEGTSLIPWDNNPSCFDTLRTRIVGFPLKLSTSINWMQTVDIGTAGAPVSQVEVTGPMRGADLYGAGACYDPDNDRYLVATQSVVYSVVASGVNAGLSSVFYTPTAKPGYDNTSGVWTRIAYWPDLKCVTYLPYYTSKVLVLITA